MSAAYYAVFHHLILIASRHQLPQASDIDQFRLTRKYQHAALLKVCEHVSGTSDITITPKGTGWAIVRLRSNTVLVDVAGTFKELQQARHEADYDHTATFTKPGALTLIDSAKDAIRKLDNLEGSNDMSLFLTLLTLQTS